METKKEEKISYNMLIMTEIMFSDDTYYNVKNFCTF